MRSAESAWVPTKVPTVTPECNPELHEFLTRRSGPRGRDTFKSKLNDAIKRALQEPISPVSHGAATGPPAPLEVQPNALVTQSVGDEQSNIQNQEPPDLDWHDLPMPDVRTIGRSRN